MKFHWFHLMPWPKLGADFTERYHSSWVDPPASEIYDPVLGHQIYNDYLDELEFADQCGFDGICVNEHHSNVYGMMPSPNIMAASLARRTQHAKLVLMGNSVVLYNPPIRVAEEMAMLDVISGGRVVSGFPVGSPGDTVYAYSQNPATVREKYAESVDLILRAWKSTEPFAFNGKYTQMRYVNPWPRPIQQPHPPIWVPGSGSVETWEWCASNEFLYAYLSYWGYEAGIATMNGYWETLDRLGIQRNPYRAGFLQFIGVADTDAEAERLYAGAASYFYQKCLHVYPGFSSPPGYTSPKTMRSGVTSQVRRFAEDPTSLKWKDFMDRSYIVAGSVDTVVDKLNEMADHMNVGHLMLLLHFGNMPKETVLYNTDKFAREVIPRLRDRYDDEWEDSWWPKDTLETIAEPAGGFVGQTMAGRA